MAEEKKSTKKNTKANGSKKTTSKKTTTKKSSKSNVEKKVEKEIIKEEVKTPKKEKVKEVANDAIENEVGKVKDVVNEIYNFNDEKGKTPKCKRNYIIIFLLGILVGLLIMMFCVPGRIAKLANGEEVIVQIGDKNVTANDLYKEMKDYYSIGLLLNTVDDIILTDLYPVDNDMKKEVNEMADYYISMYESYYGYTEEEFLEANNFSTRDEFIDALNLDYRRNKYYEEYVKNSITKKEIDDYYENKVFGEVETKYISVTKDNESAYNIILDIISKLNNGSTYNDIVTEYGERIKSEDLGYVSFKSELDDVYVDTLKSLDEYTYSINPIEFDNDYKVIFKSETKEKEKLEDIENDIIDILANKKKQEDSTLTYQALINMRKENKMSILDTDFAKKYDTYIKENTNEE